MQGDGASVRNLVDFLFSQDHIDNKFAQHPIWYPALKWPAYFYANMMAYSVTSV
jgi:hypothetical protein